MDGGHHFAHRVERSFAYARILLHELRLRHPVFGGVVDERAFRRLADGFVRIGVERRVRAERHRGFERLFVVRRVLDDGHLVLRQSARLVGADYLRAAERLDGCELADYRVSARHVRDAYREHYRDDGGEPLRYRGDGERDGDHEGREERVARYARFAAVRAEEADGEYHGAYPYYEDGEEFAELVQLYLKRRLVLLRVFERVGYLPHLGVHAGAGQHRHAAPVDDRRAHVDHVLAVAERHVLFALEVEDAHYFIDGDGFSRKRRLLYLHARAFDDASVCGDGVARFEHDDVAGDELLALERRYLPVAQHLARRRRYFLKRGDGCLGLALLHDAEHRVDDYDEHDDYHVGERLSLVEGRDAGNNRRDDEDDNHRVGQFVEEALPERRLLALFQLVPAIFLEPFRSLPARQALRGAVELAQDFLVGR